MKLLSMILIAFSIQLSALEGLKSGSKSPIESIKAVNGEKINLKGKTTVVVFYRGAWCPYCMTQLKSLQSEVFPKLEKGQQMIAVSVDNVVTTKKMIRKFDFKFPVVSDSKAYLLKKFKIVNQLSDELVTKYRNSYKIDVEGDSGEKHHMVAHPAVFIIGKDGKIAFADIHENYKERTDNKAVLKELKNSINE